jgi:pimeloyl-ACP methyl ester carboxylesterase
MKVVSLAMGIALFSVLAACAVKQLGGDIDRADASYGYVKLVAPTVNSASKWISVALYVQDSGGSKLVGVRYPLPGEDAIFLVPIDRYSVVAFEDLNGDENYQRGEPAQLIEDIPLSTVGSGAADEYSIDRTNYSLTDLTAQKLRLSASNQLPFPVDLTAQSLDSRLSRAANNFLVVTDFEDRRFAPEAIQRGMWEPLSFEEEIGYGLYLLEPLDLSKQPVLFVHGINGSPTQFKELIEALGDRFQPLLLQYPSGFPLDHSAYILQAGIDEFLQRYPEVTLHIVAHSMGGLITRGAIVSAAEATSDRIGQFITLSTPWLGHDAARLGVEWSPVVAPVWRSMVPNSDYLQDIFARPLPSSIEHHLFFSFARKTGGPGAADDGVVTVKSQLAYQAQLEAATIRGVDDNHNGILQSAFVVQWLNRILAPAS